MNAIFSCRYLGLLATSLLLGFVATVYALRPGGGVQLQPRESARLQGAPQYRVVSDPVELAQLASAPGPAVGVVADMPAPGNLRDVPAGDASTDQGLASANATHSASESAQAAPVSMGLTPQAADPADSDAAISELKDMGMAMLSGSSGNWFTLQTAYVAAEDLDLLKRRILEASSALGSRDGLFVYSAQRDGRRYYGVCVRRFDTGTSAKGFKGRLDARLGYPSQLRSKKGLQKELGF